MIAAIVYVVLNGLPITPWWQLFLGGAGAAILGGVVTWISTGRTANVQRTHDQAMAEANRAHERTLAEEERSQARKMDAYVALLRHLGNWIRGIQFRLKTFRTSTEMAPNFDPVSYELEARLNLFASPQVNAMLRDNTRLCEQWSLTVGEYNDADARCKGAATLQESSTFGEQRKQAWDQLTSLGPKILQSSNILMRQARLELGVDSPEDDAVTVTPASGPLGS